MTVVALRSVLSHTSGFRWLGSALAALGGVVAISVGLWLAVEGAKRSGNATAANVAGPVALVMAGVLLLRTRGAELRPRSERSHVDNIAIWVASASQLGLGLALVWLTVSDPVDARTNVVIGTTSILLVAGGLALAESSLHDR